VCAPNSIARTLYNLTGDLTKVVWWRWGQRDGFVGVLLTTFHPGTFSNLDLTALGDDSRTSVHGGLLRVECDQLELRRVAVGVPQLDSEAEYVYLEENRKTPVNSLCPSGQTPPPLITHPSETVPIWCS